MPTPTYIALATTTLTSSASTVTFSSIPQTYRDLCLIVYGRTDAARRYEFCALEFNGDISSSYTSTNFYWENGGFGSYTASDGNGFNILGVMGAQAATDHFNTNKFDILDYSATDKHKIVLFSADDPGRQSYVYAGRYPLTNQITSLKFKTVQGASFVAGTMLSLYGIAS